MMLMRWWLQLIGTNRLVGHASYKCSSLLPEEWESGLSHHVLPLLHLHWGKKAGNHKQLGLCCELPAQGSNAPEQTQGSLGESFCSVLLAAETPAAHLAWSQEDECMNPLHIWALSI